MLTYINNKVSCRNKMVLEYFGEVVLEDCRICDICLKMEERLVLEVIQQLLEDELVYINDGNQYELK